ncbi:MAG: phosphoribosylglycinamide formyltransferase [Tannerella sp.]|jgi:phosphoribosylglycinamide formyltransferase-1|nr:phosphoribosylglycinamide formyltransferase [Tannerella sp.]
MKRIAILASGSGSNAENIANCFAVRKQVEVAVVMSNNPRAGVHERMKRLGIPSFTFPREAFTTGDEVLKKLSEFAVDWIVLAGFMNRISAPLLRAYPDRILNIHPALLPKYGGKGMYGMHVHEAVVAHRETESGITIHYINENYDEGQIVFQAKCPVLPTDTPEDVATRVHELEYKHYPEVIEKLLTETE